MYNSRPMYMYILTVIRQLTWGLFQSLRTKRSISSLDIKMILKYYRMFHQQR